MTDLNLLAPRLGISDRTLRRAAGRGTIRCLRRSERKLELPLEEAVYLGKRWPLLQRLVRELRTLPDVRLAVLFGSTARGDEHEGSDLDILVRFAEPTLRARSRLLGRLEQAVQRKIQIVSLEDANALLLADVLRDGRVLVDRDGDWRQLGRRATKIRAEAEQARAQLQTDLDELGALLREGAPS
jgi:predicted nucleotidyltransferase